MFYYNKLSDNLIEKYGEKVYKLSLDGKMTCPNRDGKISSGGCIFCSKGGSGEFAEPSCGDVTLQIERAKQRVKNKAKNKFIAYFQNYTNTYAPINYLEKLFTDAISCDDIVALSIGTRPDCLGDDVLALLNRLNKIKPVTIELGLQTIHEKTAEFINRGYKLAVYDKAVCDLKSIGVNVVTHVILGLPFETREMMLQTVKYVGAVTDGIKLQNLQVLKDTPLSELYDKGEVALFERDEYIDLLCDCLSVLPKNVVVHRLTGDPPKNLLIAPKWCLDKKVTLNAITKAFSERGVEQGKDSDF